MTDYATYQFRTASAATLLRSAGAKEGRPIVAISKSPEAAAILACAAAQIAAPFFPVDASLPPAVIGELIEQIGCCTLVGDGQRLGTDAILAADIAAPLQWAPTPGLALFIATSGTSGNPKIVSLTGSNLVASASASAAVTPLGPGDRWLACLPLFHIGGFSILTRCALAGAEAVLHEGFHGEKVFRSLQEQRITHVSLTPTMLALLLEHETPPPPTLRHALVGGATLSPVLARKAADLSWPIQPTYGMSETSSQIATLAALPHHWQAGHVGKPLAGSEAALTEDGRLKVRGPTVMAGYANPSLAPGDGLEGGWFVTSDLAEITADGEIIVIGRADGAIVTGGKKVHPARIEDLVAACPGVRHVSVTGRPDAVWGEIVTAIFCGDLTAQELLDWSRRNIAGAYRPRAALRIDRLPLLANGKPNRSALRELALHGETEPRS